MFPKTNAFQWFSNAIQKRLHHFSNSLQHFETLSNTFPNTFLDNYFSFIICQSINLFRKKPFALKTQKVL